MSYNIILQKYQNTTQISSLCSLLLPEFLQAPEVSGVILQILHLHPHHGPGRRPVVVIIRVLDGQQVGREGRVEGVGHQDKLERDFLLQLNGNGVCLLQGELLDWGRTVDTAWFTLRKTALPQRSSLRDVNWWTRHFRNAQAASSYCLSVQVHSASNIGFTKKSNKNILFPGL